MKRLRHSPVEMNDLTERKVHSVTMIDQHKNKMPLFIKTIEICFHNSGVWKSQRGPGGFCLWWELSP